MKIHPEVPHKKKQGWSWESESAQPTAKSKCPSSIWKQKGPGTKSISVVAKVAWCKINFIGLLLYKKEVRTNSDYRICTCSILYGLVSKPALPPESPGASSPQFSIQTNHPFNLANAPISSLLASPAFFFVHLVDRGKQR